MSKFIIYTYQFSPLSNRQDSLFEKNYSDEELMEKKQEFFNEIILDKESDYRYRNKKFDHKVIAQQDGIVVFRIANSKTLILEEDFCKKEYKYSPSCLVIVDNRKDIQRIAIEEDIKAFCDTNVVQNILMSSYKNHLKHYGLGIKIKREYQKTEFWNVINDHQDEITMVRFYLSYPNLPRLQQTIKNIIADTSRNTNSKSTTIELKAGENEALNISENDQDMVDLSKASADGGDVIKIKAKRVKGFISTGNTYKSFECEDLEASMKDDLFQTGIAKLKELLDNLLK